MAIIISCSIDKRQSEFISDAKLSPSAILQRAINEMMDRDEVSPQYVKGLQINIASMQETIKKLGTFIDKHGLMNEYVDTS